MHASPFTHKVGLCLRPAHYSYLEEKPATDAAWFEAVSENHMYSRGYSLEALQLIRQDYPIALQGTSMNIGNPEGPSLHYLQKLRDLIERIDPFTVSDHFCWTGTSDFQLQGLLPLPFTKDAIETLVTNVDFVQNFLRRPLALKNTATYISYHHNEMSEGEFLTAVAQRSGCGLVLDLSNAYINSYNHNFDLKQFLNHIPFERIAQVQLSNHMNFGDFLFDSRSQEISEPIWDLFASLAPKIRHLPVLLSREEDIPHFSELENEVTKAVLILENSYETERITETV